MGGLDASIYRSICGPAGRVGIGGGVRADVAVAVQFSGRGRLEGGVEGGEPADGGSYQRAPMWVRPVVVGLIEEPEVVGPHRGRCVLRRPLERKNGQDL